VQKLYRRNKTGEEMKVFSEEWWKIIEANRIEKAHKFAPNADVLSAMSARAMVFDALTLRRIELEKK